jgi:hypothetical protein
MTDPSLGLVATCHECGGDHHRTKYTRLGAPVTGLGPDTGEREREIELICTSCRRRVWVAIGTESPAPLEAA